MVSLTRGRCLTMRSKMRRAFFQAAAGERHLDYALTVTRPLLDLVEVAVVRNRRLFGFFIGPIRHDNRPPALGQVVRQSRDYSAARIQALQRSIALAQRSDASMTLSCWSSRIDLAFLAIETASVLIANRASTLTTSTEALLLVGCKNSASPALRAMSIPFIVQSRGWSAEDMENKTGRASPA
jgi:hypothetical protein